MLSSYLPFNISSRKVSLLKFYRHFSFFFHCLNYTVLKKKSFMSYVNSAYFVYQLTACGRMLTEKLIVVTFYGTQIFIIIFPRPCHWILSQASLIKSRTSHPLCLGQVSNIHLCLGLTSPLFPNMLLISFQFPFQSLVFGGCA